MLSFTLGNSKSTDFSMSSASTNRQACAMLKLERMRDSAFKFPSPILSERIHIFRENSLA